MRRPFPSLPRLLLASALLFAGTLPAFAQDAIHTDGIEQRMTPEQFKAAGLDKLSAGELGSLNQWLNGTIQTETAKATKQAKEKVEDENRGFFNFGSSEPVSGTLVGEFRGFSKGRTYDLDNGQQWRQTDAATLAGVRLTNPKVKITPSLIGNAWYMAIGTYNTRAKVERVK